MTGGKNHENRGVRNRLWNASMTIVLIILTCVFLWSSLGLSRVSAWVPQLILSTTLFVLLLQVVLDLLEPGQPDKAGSNNVFTAVLKVLLWIAGMLLLVWLAGVSIGAALFCLAYMRFYAGERWVVAGGFAAGLGLGVQMFFGTLMQVSLYQGAFLTLFMN